ncbi:hypothetical protein F2Q70_00004128 [Brassica cretica]|uniref:Uncharacterized protein n=1 Tax=Brassica cretica TaxID=69181 RepID=A0A8S9ING9_BRACR|nr:hypothetical protein F2Q70_00004128 [Brassica cretica]
MVATLILVRDEKGDLHDQEGHLRNAAGQRIDAHGAAIPESDTDTTCTTLPADEAARPKTLVDYNHADQFYTNRSDIRPPTIQRGNFESGKQNGNFYGQRNDDFWQVVKQEKLQERDFEVESSMSFSGSHWCRSTQNFEHRSTDFDQNQSTGYPEHRSVTYGVNHILQCLEEPDSRGVRSKTPTSAQPCLCQNRSTFRYCRRST